MSTSEIHSGGAREGRHSATPASFRAAWIFGVLAICLGLVALLRPTTLNPSLNPPPRDNVVGESTARPHPSEYTTATAMEPKKSPTLEKPLSPRIREIYFLEVELRSKLLAILGTQGADAAFRTAVQWVESDQSDQEGRLRTLIALRALPGLAKETGSMERAQEALEILLQHFYDPTASRNVLHETADALAGYRVCYLRDEDLSRQQGLIKGGKCSGHVLWSGIPDCSDDPLTQWRTWEPFHKDPRVLAALEFVATDPSGQFGSTWAGKASLELAEVDPERASRFLWVFYDGLENKERAASPVVLDADGDGPIINSIRVRATSRSGFILEYTRPENAAFQAVLEIGMTSPSAQIRAGILEALNNSREGWAEYDPDLTQYFSQTIHFAVEARDQDPAVREWLVVQTAERIRSMFETKTKFKDEQQYERHLALMDSARPVYRRAVEAVLAVPGSEVPEDWKRHLKCLDYVPPDGWAVGKKKIALPPEQLLGRYLRTILIEHPESERARAMLTSADQFEREQH